MHQPAHRGQHREAMSLTDDTAPAVLLTPRVRFYVEELLSGSIDQLNARPRRRVDVALVCHPVPRTTGSSSIATSDDHRRPAQLLDQVNVFRYVTAKNAPVYRAIMAVCADAMQRYVVELRAGDILTALRDSHYVVDVADVDELESQHLDQLVKWGNLAATHDPVGVDRLSDFYQRRLVYHLTDVGEAAQRAVAEVEATLGRSGSLQTNMLVKVQEGLTGLATVGADAAGHNDPESLVRILHDVTAAFDTLTHEANRFMTDLGALMTEDRDDATSDERFAAYKQAVLRYISRFVDELRRLADDIVATVRQLDGDEITAVIATASRSADLPDFDGSGQARLAWVQTQQTKWSGIVAWFVGDKEPATVDRLADFAVGAVLGLTRTLGRLNDRRGRTLDRTQDYLTLARWFAECADDDAAHELWHAVFGLHSARHTHLAEDDAGLTSTRSSWWDAPPVRIPTRLRSHGQVRRGSRTPKASDHTKERQWLAARARRERAQLQAASARFSGLRLRLSDVATLDGHEFDLLLDLLDTALTAARDADGRRRTRTADGRLEVLLVPPVDGATCSLQTPRGRLRGPDYELTVTDLTRPGSTSTMGATS